jgi:chorismate mutase
LTTAEVPPDGLREHVPVLQCREMNVQSQIKRCTVFNTCSCYNDDGSA